MTPKKEYIVKGATALGDLAASLARITPTKIQKMIVKTTLLSHEALVDKITNDIEPHSAMHRKRNPQESVTDLVDTGAYRASFHNQFPDVYKGQNITNAEQAAALEYGTKHMAGFFVATDVAHDMKKVFRENALEVIKEELQ